jgi:dihydrodipicolinate synthase/N-acetylneuraminate lyase
MTTTDSIDNSAVLLERMEGITVALTTPLSGDGTLDVAGLERLIERVIEGGAACLFPLGWAGEGPLLSDQTRTAVMNETCRIARGRVPVMIGVCEQSLNRSLELVAAARRAGADLVLSTAPYSYAVPDRLLADYLQDLARLGGMPVVIYQNDELGKRLPFDTLLQLSRKPGIIGTKAFVPYVELQRYFLQLHRPDRFAVMSGDEYQYAPGLLLGVRHFTMGGPGNLCPAWCTSMYQLALEGRWEAVREMHKRLVAFCDAVYTPAETAYAALKGALHCLGVCNAHICSPHAPLSDEKLKLIRAALEEYGDVIAGKPACESVMGDGMTHPARVNVCESRAAPTARVE